MSRLRAMVMMVIALVCGQPLAASGQGYPERPVRMVIPFPAGGAADFVARLVAEHMSGSLGQRVYMEHMPGAGGNIGAGAVARAQPDGYTILATVNSVITINPHLYADMRFDPLKDLAPITQMVSTHLLMVANPKLPFSTLQQALAHAKANPGALRYASFGNGSSAHITGEMLKRVAGIDMVHVPYRGSGPALNDVIAGHVDLTFDPIITSLPQVASGALRALAIMTPRRRDILPDVPSIAEQFPGFEAGGWQGILTPTGTPAAVIARLHVAATAALKDVAVRNRLVELQFDPVGNSPDEFAAVVRIDHARWGKAVRDTGIRLSN